jgi:hypothetical protein
MEALMELARQEELGWELNAGWRCDVPFVWMAVRKRFFRNFGGEPFSA